MKNLKLPIFKDSVLHNFRIWLETSGLAPWLIRHEDNKPFNKKLVSVKLSVGSQKKVSRKNTESVLMVK